MSARANEQRRPDSAFELAELVTERGLREVEPPSGAGLSTRLGDGGDESEVTQIEVPATKQPSTHGHETIVLVEDERGVRDLTKRIFESAGYTVLAAGNGAEAIALIEPHTGPIDLLMTDVVMPGMNGRELAARVAELRPEAKVLYTSGYTDDAILRHGVLDDTSRFISKPYTQLELTRRVRSILDA